MSILEQHRHPRLRDKVQPSQPNDYMLAVRAVGDDVTPVTLQWVGATDDDTHAYIMHDCGTEPTLSTQTKYTQREHLYESVHMHTFTLCGARL